MPDLSDQYPEQEKPDDAYDFERITDLGNGLAMYAVPLSMFREQDLNANVMSRDKFERLVQNIEDEGRMESTPLGWRKVAPGGDPEFEIISGHHRIRAARQAAQNVDDLRKIPTLVDETDLDRSEVHSKQLAHNALDGHDDPQVAQEIFDRIDDVTERIKSGVQEADFDLDSEPVEVDPIEVDFDQEIVNLVFLPRQYEDFDDLVSTLNDESEIYLADLEDFPDFQAIARDVSERYDIHSMPAIVHRIVEICLH